MSQSPIRVTVWNEFRHEKKPGIVQDLYPRGIHQVIADFVSGQPDMQVRTATLDEPDHGLSDEVLGQTDVMLWWGHIAHNEVSEAIVEKVHQRVLDGMGLLVLHSGHLSKIFRRLMGTSCNLKWREIGERERVWNIDPAHPIADGIPQHFDLEHSEMYGERFDIPQPEELVFVSWYAGGNVFRSGCCFHRGRGKIFYFSPGHESYPVYSDKWVQQVILNAIRWAKPSRGPKFTYGHSREPLEKIQ